MSIYDIKDITGAGAYCNAMEALRESDSRATQRRLNSRRDAEGNDSPTTILSVLRGALRRVECLTHYSGPHHMADTTR
jgi:hypothetical protein